MTTRSGSSARGQRAGKKGPRTRAPRRIDFSDRPEASDDQLRAMRRVGRPPLGDRARQLIAIRLDLQPLMPGGVGSSSDGGEKASDRCQNSWHWTTDKWLRIPRGDDRRSPAQHRWHTAHFAPDVSGYNSVNRFAGGRLAMANVNSDNPAAQSPTVVLLAPGAQPRRSLSLINRPIVLGDDGDGLAAGQAVERERK
jgi:hypothetical protein